MYPIRRRHNGVEQLQSIRLGFFPKPHRADRRPIAPPHRWGPAAPKRQTLSEEDRHHLWPDSSDIRGLRRLVRPPSSWPFDSRRREGSSGRNPFSEFPRFCGAKIRWRYWLLMRSLPIWLIARPASILTYAILCGSHPKGIAHHRPE